MNQKGSSNVILVIIIIVLLSALGYFFFLKKSDPIAEQRNTNSTQTADKTKVTDKGNLYSFEIPKDWKVTESMGARGVSLSNIHIESPDWKSHSVKILEGPYSDNIYYDNGAYFSVSASTLVNENPLAYSNASSKKNITIDGVSSTVHIYKEPSLAEGQLLGASLVYKGKRYSFTFGYNPTTYPNGEVVFTEILDSFRFTE